MKSVLISIQPKWCELIASGKKTVEVRKARPKPETSFKAYIYETQGRTETPFVDEDGHEIFKGRGQVIGEFVCDCITPLYNVCYDEWERLLGGLHRIEKELVGQACLSEKELHSYANGKRCYAWHISNLVIYDKPKSLSKFVRQRRCYEENINESCSETCSEYADGECDGKYVSIRPPQSWCYVEKVLG